MKRFYSQNREDEILSIIFRGTVGTCVEVGAYDGIQLSNTYHFEQIGWRCILIEANHYLCDKIRQVRNAEVFEYAASDHAGVTQLHIGDGDDSLYSSVEPNSASCCGKSVVVETRTLDMILEEAGVWSIVFMSIDVEGHEPAVLRGLSLDRWKPTIVLIEDSSHLADPEVEVRLRKAGYARFYRTGANDWYARKSSGRLRLLARIAMADAFSWRALCKGVLPRPIVRRVLLAKWALSKLRYRRCPRKVIL